MQGGGWHFSFQSMTNFIREKERIRHLCSSAEFLTRQEEVSERREEGRTSILSPGIIEVVCSVPLGKKISLPSGISKIMPWTFPKKGHINANLKDNYSCRLFWNLSSGIWFKTLVSKKWNGVYWLFLPEPCSSSCPNLLHWVYWGLNEEQERKV